ncbi:uncharacterized protein [Atheta coriaria]|uniref:uncharacterized protein n=1 Tax=Dalotia coriaria TaxID=877792 RepID=UPI0031F43857
MFSLVLDCNMNGRHECHIRGLSKEDLLAVIRTSKFNEIADVIETFNICGSDLLDMKEYDALRKVGHANRKLFVELLNCVQETPQILFPLKPTLKPRVSFISRQVSSPKETSKVITNELNGMFAQLNTSDVFKSGKNVKEDPSSMTKQILSPTETSKGMTNPLNGMLAQLSSPEVLKPVKKIEEEQIQITETEIKDVRLLPEVDLDQIKNSVMKMLPNILSRNKSFKKPPPPTSPKPTKQRNNNKLQETTAAVVETVDSKKEPTGTHQNTNGFKFAFSQKELIELDSNPKTLSFDDHNSDQFYKIPKSFSPRIERKLVNNNIPEKDDDNIPKTLLFDGDNSDQFYKIPKSFPPKMERELINNNILTSDDHNSELFYKIPKSFPAKMERESNMNNIPGKSDDNVSRTLSSEEDNSGQFYKIPKSFPPKMVQELINNNIRRKNDDIVALSSDDHDSEQFYKIPKSFSPKMVQELINNNILRQNDDIVALSSDDHDSEQFYKIPKSFPPKVEQEAIYNDIPDINANKVNENIYETTRLPRSDDEPPELPERPANLIFTAKKKQIKQRQHSPDDESNNHDHLDNEHYRRLPKLSSQPHMPLPPSPAESLLVPRDTLRSNQFFRDCTRSEAVQLLETKRVGTFLLRPSSRPQFWGVLVLNGELGVQNIPLCYNNYTNEYYFASKSGDLQATRFSSFDSLLNYYKDHAINGELLLGSEVNILS